MTWFNNGKECVPYYTWMTEVRDKPIYLQKPDPNIPCSIPFPLADVLRQFGTPSPYFTNTVSWMIAYAISLKPTDIGVFGVDMAQTVEYRAQRPSCEYLLGWARGLGINVHIPGTSDLLKLRMLYGFQHDNGVLHEKWTARAAELDQRIVNQKKKRDDAAAMVFTLQGARESHEYIDQYLGEQWTLDSLLEPRARPST